MVTRLGFSGNDTLLHNEAIHQRKKLCLILANALDNAQLPYLEVHV